MAVEILIPTPEVDLYADAEFVRGEHGAIIVGGVQCASTLQCCHCGAHWIPRRGSGIKRGYCTNCAQVICGRAECMQECVPFEKALELMEKAARRQV